MALKTFTIYEGGGGKLKFVKYFDVDSFEILCKYGGFV